MNQCNTGRREFVSKREAVRGSDADRRRTANRERPDRFRDSRRALAAQLDDLFRQPPLVENDDRIVLQADDAVGSQRGYVPSSQLARYFACSSVS